METEEVPELLSLRAFYDDLDQGIVDAVWHKNDHDYKASMEELAQIAKNPSAAKGLGTSGDAATGLGDHYVLKPPMSSTVSEAGLPSGGVDDTRVDRPRVTTAEQSSAWDFSSVLSDLGQTVSEGITGLADNISDFVADLASAFDAGWEDEGQSHPGLPEHTPDRDTAVVMHGGMESQRVSNRRQPALASSSLSTTIERQDSDEKKDD